MKKLIIPAIALAVSCSVAASASAQNGKPTVHKVGLIDMAHVFKNYKKFKAMRDDLKTEIEAIDRQNKSLTTRIQTLRKEIQSKTFAENSPELKARRDELIELSSKYDSIRKKAQLEFMKKEADIYKTVYMEVTDAVRQYAEYYKYTLILRFNRDDIKDAGNPQAILQHMNRQVVYYKPGEDITSSVLDYLNRKWTGGTAKK